MKWIIIACTLITVLTGAFFLLTLDSSDNESKEIVSFDNLTLHMSGMRGGYDYEIVNKEDRSDVCKYIERYRDGEDTKELEKCVSVDTSAVIQILNDCQLLEWDGFHGEHPRFVKDGKMFNLTAQVNDGQMIHADGSANFPNHFHELEQWISQTLNQEDNNDEQP